MKNYGISKGKIEGEKSGFAKGKKSGISKAKKETAKNFLKLGVDIETISRATGLSKEELEKLKNE